MGVKSKTTTTNKPTHISGRGKGKYYSQAFTRGKLSGKPLKVEQYL